MKRKPDYPRHSKAEKTTPESSNFVVPEFFSARGLIEPISLQFLLQASLLILLF